MKVSRIIVFGSQAKGASTEESDIDIIIISEDFKKFGERLSKNEQLIFKNISRNPGISIKKLTEIIDTGDFKND